ncbi:MAG: hypothetical protein ABIP03_15215, partial [Aquihabitans sp.]
VGAFVPTFVAFALVVGVALALGSLFCFRVAGVARLLTVTVGAALVAFMLNLPWSLDLITAPAPWQAMGGVGGAEGGTLDLGRVLRFESGPWGAAPLGWAFLLAGALPVIIGRSWRLEWAVRAWFVVLAGWGVLWAGQAGHLPFGLPAPEVVLAPVAAGLSLTAALGLASFEIDLRAYRFGWRQILSVAAATGVVLGAIPLGAGLLDGRWRMPSRDYRAPLDDLVATERGTPFRVLWVGDPEVLPAAGWRLDDQVSYTTTDRGSPTMLDRFSVAPPGQTERVADALRLTQDRRTNRLGHLLAPMGIRYLVVPSQLAPNTTAGSGVRTPPASLTNTLGQQLDLEEVPLSDGLVVYRNIAAIASRSVLPDREGDRTRFTDAADDDLSSASPALTADVGAVDARGDVSAVGDLLVAQSADPKWVLRIDGVPMARRTDYGWANTFTATRKGSATLRYNTPLTHRLWSGGQAVAWAFVIEVRRRSRRAERIATDGLDS